MIFSHSFILFPSLKLIFIDLNYPLEQTATLLHNMDSLVFAAGRLHRCSERCLRLIILLFLIRFPAANITAYNTSDNTKRPANLSATSKKMNESKRHTSQSSHLSQRK